MSQPPMGSLCSVSAQQKGKAQSSQSTRKRALPDHEISGPTADTSNTDTRGSRKRTLTNKGRELDLVALAMSEEGDGDDGHDTDFLPETITLPDLEETLSGTESDEPALVQPLQKRGRGRPAKARVPDSAQGIVILTFFSCWTRHSLHIYRICLLGPFGPFYWCWSAHNADECII